jgi:hypothetical protein
MENLAILGVAVLALIGVLSIIAWISPEMRQ